MNTINLSYIITTKNKLKYLRCVIEKLIKEIQFDEEIVVVDSNSTDGTKEYLSELYNKKLIHKYLSENDNAQAHGCNKALLMAEGKLLKIINDDDAFLYEGIRKCKIFMLEHPEFDLIGMDGAGTNCLESTVIFHSTFPEYLNMFNKWKINKTPFAFCDLGLMIRKSSLSYLGLFNPAFYRLDAEYTFRASYLSKTKIAWYTGHCWVRIANEKSVSVNNPKSMINEWEKLELIYLGKIPEKHKIATLKKEKKIFLLIRIIMKLKNKIKKIIYILLKNKNQEVIQEDISKINNYIWDDLYEKSELWLNEINKENSASFYY